MKHLVKKYVNSGKLESDTVEAIKNAPIDEKVLAEIAKDKMKDHFALAVTEDNQIYQTFKYQNGNDVYLIPEPDPIIIYFDTSLHFLKEVAERRNQLLSKMNIHGDFMAVNGDFYWYFASVSSHIIFLFLAIEAFINRAVPDDFEYRRPIQKKKTELYVGIQIQRSIEFLEKIKEVLPQATNKNFVSEFSHKYESIQQLKKFRDDIVHTKSFSGTSPNFYEDLFVKSLDFEFDKTLYAVRDFINYHRPNLIEECDCGND